MVNVPVRSWSQYYTYMNRDPFVISDFTCKIPNSFTLLRFVCNCLILPVILKNGQPTYHVVKQPIN